MHKSLLYLLVFLSPVISFAQRSQRIQGRVLDKESKSPLMGVIISVTDVNPVPGAVSDSNGNYLIENVPTGKHTIKVSYTGYDGLILNDILVTSGKEVILPLELEERAVRMDEVTVTQKKDHINDMAIVSVKTFDVQETERYAGSRADPARMASNFAGVQGGDDSRNDIVVRGNSPQGVLWRLEGVDIPNPNHFSIPGTSGGPVSMLNSKTLANSDFFMGAFPAEYGNAIAGAFDVRLRNGNSERYEFTGQLGFLGTELAAEGPISRKSGSSFLINYRYSTLKLFEGLNIKIGTSSVPSYQDLTFKLNFPIGKKSTLSLFGIGGLSKIDLIVSNQTKFSDELYGESDRDQYFKSNTGVAGISYSYNINSSAYTKLVIAESGNQIAAQHNYVFRDAGTFAVDSLKNILGYDYKTLTTTAHWFLNKKISANHTIKLGILNNLYHLDLVDSSRQYPVNRQDWQYRQNFHGYTDIVQAYIQYKYRPTENLTITAGLHAQYLTHNNTKSLEPRIAARYLAGKSSVITFGYGLHSQTLPIYQYFQHLPQYTAAQMQNYNVDFMRSHHLVLGYDQKITNTLRARVETYYQYLFNVPIENRVGSSYSALNQGSSYSRDFPDTLINKGTGYNYGLELTLEKSFSHGYYFMFTGTLFNSKAKGNDGVYRNTDFNGRYTINLLGGYELKTGKNSTLITGLKVTYAGGKLYSPADTAASSLKSDLVIYDSARNTLKFKDYFRLDIKLGYRINAKKVTHEIGIDLVNVLNTQNILSQTYSTVDIPGKGHYYEQYQLGFLPLFYYRIDFGIKRKQ